MVEIGMTTVKVESRSFGTWIRCRRRAAPDSPAEALRAPERNLPPRRRRDRAMAGLASSVAATRLSSAGAPTASATSRSIAHFPRNARRRARSYACSAASASRGALRRERLQRVGSEQLAPSKRRVDPLARERVEEVRRIPHERHASPPRARRVHANGPVTRTGRRARGVRHARRDVRVRRDPPLEKAPRDRQQRFPSRSRAELPRQHS